MLKAGDKVTLSPTFASNIKDGVNRSKFVIPSGLTLNVVSVKGKEAVCEWKLKNVNYERKFSISQLVKRDD